MSRQEKIRNATDEIFGAGNRGCVALDCVFGQNDGQAGTQLGCTCIHKEKTPEELHMVLTILAGVIENLVEKVTTPCSSCGNPPRKFWKDRGWAG